MNCVVRSVVVALVVNCSPVWAQGKLDVQAFGGTYQVECGEAGTTAAAPAPSQPSSGANTSKTFKGYSLSELSASGLLYNAQAKATYYKALGPLSKEPWLARLDGPSPQNKPVRVAGADYVLLSACKNHDCAENNTVLLYSSAPELVYGKVYQRGKSTLIGAPPPAVASELEALWKKEWRSQPK